MKSITYNLQAKFIGFLMLAVAFWSFGQTDTSKTEKYKPSTKPTYKFEDRNGDSYGSGSGSSPMILPDPSKVVKTVELSEDGKYYIIREKIGDIDYRPPTRMTLEQYARYKKQQEAKTYWKENSLKQDAERPDSAGKPNSKSIIPPIYVSPKFDRIFGGNYIDIKPNGNVTLDFGGNWQRIDNPSLPIRVQRQGGFVFNQNIMLNLQGKIGEKLSVSINWDTKAAFDFDNKIKLSYKGLDHDIIKTIEAGNVSMPTGSALIQGAQNLFGIKTQMQFGKLKATTILANQRGKNESITIPSSAGSVGSATGKEIEISCVAYEENRHYFLAQIFRNNYEQAFNSSPLISSNYVVTRCEVYVTNRNNITKNVRNFLAFADLGEGSPYNTSLKNSGAFSRVVASNDNNGLGRILSTSQDRLRDDTLSISAELGTYFTNTIDYEKVKNSRLLEEGKDYKINKQLGYISLSQNLDQSDVLAVAFEYQYNGQTFKVGEFSQDLNGEGDGSKFLFLKLLKSNNINSHLELPMWDLMMKNVYNLGVTNLSKQGMAMTVVYKDDATKLSNTSILEGKNTANINLLTLFNADRLNANNENQSDGFFDYVEKFTIDPDYGRLYFPVLEPFGSTLRSKFDESTEKSLIDKYVFQQLYDTTKLSLQANASSNKIKFYLKGRVQSGTSGDISLSGLNISPTSVKVYAGSRLLSQGTDYTISSDGSKITLSQEVMNSGSEIKVSYEKADLFSFRQKSLVGTRFDYTLSKDINIGATIMHMGEKPNITRTNIGDEPIKNTMLGFDVNYMKDSRLITKLVDKLPMISTKAPSSVQFSAEYAALLPGNSNATGNNSFLDDFEGTRNPFDLTKSVQKWKFSSPPTTFKSNTGVNDLSYGYKRAKLAWYNIDNSFYRDGGGSRGRPSNISNDDIENYHYTRNIRPNEIFPQKSVTAGQINETTLDLAYFPDERGPYNYQTDLDNNGLLKNPQQNFAGITRALSPGMDSDFDNLNVQYIDFWMMDPFIEAANNGGVRIINPKTGEYETIENTTGGDLFFNLGNVSEDVLSDERQSFENGLPSDGNKNASNVTFNNWGAISTQQYIIDNFSAGARANQDVGLDGFSTLEENTYEKFQPFINSIKNNATISQSAKDKILADISADDFKYYLGSDQDNKKIIDRYKDFNGIENNSPETATDASYTASATNIPDNEDLNKNNTIETDESYYEYKVSVKKEDFVVGRNYIISKLVSTSGDGKPSTWYQFRIPLRDTADGRVRVVGDANLKSVRFMRMYLTNFQQPVIMRMAQFQLVASQWRPQPESFNDSKAKLVTEPPSDAGFSVSTVNIEENNVKTGVSSKYVLPPGFIRDQNNSSNVLQYNNEQSLRMCVDGLKGGNIRFASKDFSTTLGTASGVNCINFEQLKMFLHAESPNNPRATSKEDVRALLRFGTDATDNYYEVEVPLKLSNVDLDNPEDVWPSENEININIADLSALKALRGYNNPTDTNSQRTVDRVINGHIYRIKGNPDITAVKLFMVGVYNPSPDSLDSKSFCIWADELRLSGYNKKAAQALTASTSINLADLGTIKLSGQYQSVGFGGLDQKISERNTEEKIQYNATASLNMHKFLPQSLGLKIPVVMSQNVVKSNPYYDPANPDVILKNSAALKENPDEYIKMVSPKTVNKSIGITNLQKVKTKPDAKKHFYDIENISVSLGYNTTNQTSYQIAYYNSFTYTGQINYNYSFKTRNLEPFKKTKALSSNYFKLVKDFNVSLMPTNIALKADMKRFFSEKQLRNSDLTTTGVAPIFNKFWTFDRSYSLRWSLTKSLSLDYLADAKAIIDEPEGRIDNSIDSKTGLAKKQIVKNSLNDLGRVKNFNQSLTANYKLPFDKIPLVDWIGADANLKLNYIWEANASKVLADSLGNKIENSRAGTLSGKLDFLKLYNKSKYLKKINNPPPNKEPLKKKVYRKRADGKIDTVEVEVKQFELGKTFLRKVMTLRNVNISFTQTEKTAIPGYMPRTKYLGFDESFNAPGVEFMLGSQNLGRFKNESNAKGGWISTDARQSQNIVQSIDQKLNLSTQIEPIKDFRLSITAIKNKNSSYNELYKNTDTLQNGLLPNLENVSSTRTGSYDLSVVSIGTAFKDPDALFEQFKNERAVIASRLTEGPNTGKLYTSNSQQVLIPAFISTYLGQDVGKVKLSPFPSIPLPNWKIDYSGLSNLKFIKKYFPSFTISHDYKSTYKVGSYTSSAKYKNQTLGDNKEGSYDYRTDDQIGGSFSDSLSITPRYLISEVTLTERFSPLIGIQAKTKKNVTINLKVGKERTLGLSTSNYQITEIRSMDYTVGVGYSKTGMKLPFIKVKGREQVLKNLIKMQLDVTVRDNVTIVRRMEQESRPTAGQLQIQIKPNINYQYSQKLTIQLYYSRTDLRPYTSGSFRNVNTQFGVKLVFQLN